MKKTLLFALLLILVSCNQKSKRTDSIETKQEETNAIPVEPNGGIGNGATSIEKVFITDIEQAHHKEAFLENKAVQFDIALFFGGKQRLDATITMLTNSSKINIRKKDESELIYDGEKVYLSPKDANDKGARFEIFTWTYFFGFPYKLSDPGTEWKMQGNKKLNEDTYATAKLNFEKGIGDAPDDWYIAFSDIETNLLKAAAYIVTYGSDGDTSKAESDPHIILYNNYKEISAIPIATEWKFYGWTEEKGLTQELGEATLSNIKFIDDNVASFFKVPTDHKMIPPPQ